MDTPHAAQLLTQLVIARSVLRCYQLRNFESSLPGLTTSSLPVKMTTLFHSLLTFAKNMFRPISRLSLADQLRAYAKKGDAKMVATLLNEGIRPVDLLSTGRQGKTALQLATAARKTVVVMLLQNHIEKIIQVLLLEEQLHAAASEGDHESVERILSQHIVDVDNKDDRGVTALYLASGLGHTETVKVLIKHGADVCLTSTLDDDTEETPMCRAVKHRFYDCAMLLMYAAGGKGNPFPEFNAMVAAISID